MYVYIGERMFFPCCISTSISFELAITSFLQSHGISLFLLNLFILLHACSLLSSSFLHATYYFICTQENRVVDGNVERMQREERADELVVHGKVDWKGRKALKHKHGGMKVSLLILGKLGLRQFEFMHGHLPKD